MFWEEGKGWRKSMAKEVIQQKDKVGKNTWVSAPPPYKEGGQYPQVTGMVEIKGEIQMNENSGVPQMFTPMGERERERQGFEMDCYGGLREML